VALFAGNLNFDADVEDVMKSPRKYFRHCIRVSEIVIPNSNGRTKGYAFITLSWVREIIDTESYRDLQESYRVLPNMKSARFGSCPGLTIKERTAAALAWHGGH
jgi:hypothetical protein